MEITEVRIKLMEDPNDRLKGFCSVTFDGCFVIRDLKIIQGTKGPFVAMPSRKLTDRCPQCGSKNHLRSQYCNQCGTQLHEDRAIKDEDGRAKLYADIAHPINSNCREMIQSGVLKAFETEITRSTQPGYLCTYDDYGEDRIAALRQQPEAVAETLVVTGDDHKSHRIEPAGVSTGGPHHNGADKTREKQPVAAERERGNDVPDSFGAGLV